MCSALQCRHLWVFDFDDTLVRTGSRIISRRPGQEPVALSTAQFASHEPQPDETFDFSEFDRLIDPHPVPWVDAACREACALHGAERVVVLTARHTAVPVEQYLRAARLPPIRVVALGTSETGAKPEWLARRIDAGDVSDVFFFDDALRYVEAVSAIAGAYPQVSFSVRHVAA